MSYHPLDAGSVRRRGERRDRRGSGKNGLEDERRDGRGSEKWGGMGLERRDGGGGGEAFEGGVGLLGSRTKRPKGVWEWEAQGEGGSMKRWKGGVGDGDTEAGDWMQRWKSGTMEMGRERRRLARKGKEERERQRLAGKGKEGRNKRKNGRMKCESQKRGNILAMYINTLENMATPPRKERWRLAEEAHWVPCKPADINPVRL